MVAVTEISNFPLEIINHRDDILFIVTYRIFSIAVSKPYDILNIYDVLNILLYGMCYMWAGAGVGASGSAAP